MLSTRPTRLRAQLFGAKRLLLLTLLASAVFATPSRSSADHSPPAASLLATPLALFAPPAPSVSLNVPGQVPVGEAFEFQVRFKNNTGAAIGYAPYVELYMPSKGTDGNASGHKCDGIKFLSADALFDSPPSVPLTPVASALSTAAGSFDCALPYTLPFAGMTPLASAPAGDYQLVVLALPFGSFDASQPEIVINVKARVSDYADVGAPLTIRARGGFRYGADELNNHPTDPLVESAPASAATQPNVLIASKSYVGPEDETATGPNFPRRYILNVNVADGQVVNNLKLTDCIPNNMVVTGVVSSSPAPSSSSPALPLGPVNSPNNCLNFNYNSVTGTASPSDVSVVIEFYIPKADANGQVILDPSSCKNASSPDDVKASGSWTPLDPRDTATTQTSDASPVDHVLTDKRLAIQKSVKVIASSGAHPIPGDMLQYTLDFQISDYFTVGNLEVEDYLSDGQQLSTSIPPLLSVTDRFGSSAGAFSVGSTLQVTPDPNACCKFVNPAPGTDCKIKGGTVLKFKISSALAVFGTNPRHSAGILTGGYAFTPTSGGATGRIVFYAKIQDAFTYPQQPGDKFVDKDDTLTDCVILRGEIFTNVNAQSMPTGTGLVCSDDSRASVTIVPDTIKKTVYSVRRPNAVGILTNVCGPSGPACSNSLSAPQEVRPGDLVTFRIEKTIHSGDAEKVTVTDWLPLPIFDAADPDANSAPGPAWSYNNAACALPSGAGVACPLSSNTLSALGVVPVLTSSASQNSIKLDYGTFNDPTNQPRKIDVLFSVKATARPFADGLYLTNEAQECEQNTFGATFCKTAIAQVNVREPKLRVRKGVIATDDPAGVFTQPAAPPTSPPTAKPPAGATFSLAGVGGVVSSNGLAGWVDSDLSGVDANDVVTFAVVVENLGGAPAYDAQLEDIIPNIAGSPSCFTIVSPLTVKRGTGAPVISALYSTITPPTGFIVTSAPNLLSFIPAYHPNNGSNVVVITFQVKMLANVTPGCCDNTARIKRYTSQPGGPNFVTAGFGGPFQDTARVCVGPKPTKCVRTTSEPHTSADNSATGTPQPPQVAIGEIVRYRLLMTLPEGSSPFLRLADHLPPGMTYMPGTARVAFVSDGGITSSALSGPGLQLIGSKATCLSPQATFPLPPTLVAPAAFAPGVAPTFNLGIVANNDNDPNLEFVIVDFNALVNNLPANQTGAPPNQQGATLPNYYDVFVGKTIGTPVPVATSPTTDVRVVEPDIKVLKSVTPVDPAGQAVFTVTLTNTGAATAFDVKMTDTLPAGLNFTGVQPPTASPAACALPTTNVSGTTLTLNAPQMPVGCSVTVKFRVFAHSQCVTNTANVTYTSLPGGSNNTPVGTQPNATGSAVPCALANKTDCERTYTASGQASITSGCEPGTACAKPPSNMVSWWQLNLQPGATVAPDIKGGHHGTPQPNPLAAFSAQPGKVNGALFISNNNVTVPDHPALKFGTGNLSIDAWIGVAQPQFVVGIVDKLDVAAKKGYAFYSRQGKLYFVMGDGTSLTTYTSGSAFGFPGGLAWHHVAVTVDRAGGSGIFYIDGAGAGNFTPLPPASDISSGSTLQLGGSRQTFPPIGGLPPPCVCEYLLDEIEIFNDVVSVDDLRGILAAGPAGKCTTGLQKGAGRR